MCGITGIIAFNEKGKDFFKSVDTSVNILNKRGPDKKGTFFHNNIGLGHVRLSIIDVSDAASQPLFDESGNYVIVFNGEIFNFKELKQELISKGVVFKTQSDTEVVLQLYINYGNTFINRLNGFFAFSIYDKIKEKILIARDRYGIKPLVIYKDDDKLIFSSEIKGILAFGIKKEIDYVSVCNFLQLNYIPSPKTIFKNITKLTPGNFIEIKGNKIDEQQYYSILSEENKESIEYNKCSKILYDLLDDSVKSRLISDVPLGAFLSGGLDSSIIVALASKHTKNLNTFSIGFKDEPFFDETNYAEIVANHFKTNHHVFSLSNDDLLHDLYDILNYLDEPFADSSAIAVHILSKNVKNHVTVALSGDGADEIFAGYNKHSAEYRVRNKGFLENIIEIANPAIKLLPQSRNTKIGNKIRQINRFANGMKLSERDRYWLWCGFADEKDVEKLLNKTYNKAEYLTQKNYYLDCFNNKDDFNNVLLADTKLVLQNDMLVKVDLMSMANSLEVRTPFLDYRIVDFAFSLPSDFKITKLDRKKILKDTFKNILPKEILYRNKHGFEVPLLKWFRNELSGMIWNDLLEFDFVREQGIFNVDEIKLLKYKLNSSNPSDTHARIWSLIVFQYWYKKYFLN